MEQPRKRWTLEDLKAHRTHLREAYRAAVQEAEALAGEITHAARPYRRDVRKLQEAVEKVTVLYGRWLEVHRMVDPS